MPRYLGLEESLEFPRTVNFTGHLTWLAARADQCTASAANPVHPTSKDYFPGSCRQRSLDQLSVLTRPLPGGYRHPISKHYVHLLQLSLFIITYSCSSSSQPSQACMVAGPSRIFGIPTDRELHQTSYLAGSPSGSVYRFSREPCPPHLKGLFPWLLPALFSGSALSPDAPSPWRIPTPHQ
ncbi:hypothetical protein XENOCAPTIV_007159 [Xenoophorus captivus]|uniref:Uncharacterized protein n=1 Tax=Xenoophorus captivus TaxID=1517983 RepID=A0ABV0RPB3_9TELE